MSHIISISPDLVNQKWASIFDKDNNTLNLRQVDNFLDKKIDDLQMYYKLWKESKTFFTDESLNEKWEQQQQHKFYVFVDKSTPQIEELRDTLFNILSDKVAKNPKILVENQPEIEKLKNSISRTTTVFSDFERALEASASSWCSANFINNYSLKLDVRD